MKSRRLAEGIAVHTCAVLFLSREVVQIHLLEVLIGMDWGV
jgi:hypothetical protein